jgi:WD40-like Beta Propeller Repeat
MNHYLSLRKLLQVTLILLILAGCAPRPGNTTSMPNTPAGGTTLTTTAVVPGSPTEQPAGVSTQTAQVQPASAGTPLPTLTATPDTRPLPADWRNWPYVPTISARAIEIYKKGLAMGNDPHAFSVVGDCQSIPGVFLGKYDDARLYHLDPAYAALQETIETYKGSFARDGNAVRGGFTAATILSPLQADPEFCKPGETPLTCEFRVHNPSILIISLETWADPKTVDRYEIYLRQILDKSIERGVLPLLGTKADVAEVGGGKHVINPIIAKLAYEYDLPLWNFWRSAQFLPNHGIDPNRDGFHLTQEGWDLKSFVALQALDAARRAASGKPAPPTSQASLTAIPTPTFTPTTLPTPLPICNKNPDCLVFGLMESKDGDLQYRGVYWFDLNDQKLTQMAGEGYNLQDISADRKHLLINHNHELYISAPDGSNPLKISDQFFDLNKQTAYWMDGSKKVAWISVIDGQTALQLYDMAAGTSKELTHSENSPIGLYPSPDPLMIYWQKGTCSTRGVCNSAGVWVSSLEDAPAQELSRVISPVFSPDGQSFAFMDPIYNRVNEFNDILVMEKIKERLPSRRLGVFPAASGYMVRPRLAGYAWSPDSQNIFALIDDHSNYFEKSLVLHTYMISFSNNWLYQYKQLAGVMPQLSWSPDGSQIVISLTDRLKSGEYRINLQLLTFANQVVTPLLDNKDLIDTNYTYITNVYWPAYKP